MYAHFKFAGTTNWAVDGQEFRNDFEYYTFFPSQISNSHADNKPRNDTDDDGDYVQVLNPWNLHAR